MGKKKKNKKQDIWDLSFEEQQENLKKLDEFIAGTKNDLFINNDTGGDFESQLFNMIDTRRTQDIKPNKKYGNHIDIFKQDEDDGDSYILEPAVDEGPTTEVLEYQPISFDVDNELHMLFIHSRFERVGLKLNTRAISDEVEIENEHVLGRAFIDYSLYNSIPFALVDDIDNIIKAFGEYSIESYDKNKFKIIYDENDTLYRCYIVDTDSTSNLQANVIKSYREYAELILELENRSITDIDWGYFYDSSYNDIDTFAKIIASDKNTTTGDRPLTDVMADEFGYITLVSDIYGVVEPLLELFMDSEEEDESEALLDTFSEILGEKLDDLSEEVIDGVADLITTGDIPEVKIPESIKEEVTKGEEAKEEPDIDVNALKAKMQTPAEPQPSNYVTQNISLKDEDDESDDGEDVEVPEDIEITEENMDDVDFDDLTTIPVIRKQPKKK